MTLSDPELVEGESKDLTMFGHKQIKRRYTTIPFVIFRTLLSLMVFAVMLGGLYSAYKSFSGMDPLKLDSKAVLSQLLDKNNLQKLFGQSVVNNQPSQPAVNPNRKPSFSFLLVADSHSENSYLNRALSQAKEKYPDIKFIIGLGDYTEVGTVDELKKAKVELDPIGIRYFLVPGDHDMWDARDKQKSAKENFVAVFGPTYQAFTYQGIRFILLDNADNYLGLGAEQLKWLNLEFERTRQDSEVKVVLAFMHEPLYHPSSTHIMGAEDPNLKEEAKNLARWLKENNTKGVFYGDIHFFTKYQNPDGLVMVTVGAVASQRNPQNPRYAIVYVYDDLSYEVEDVEIR